MDLGVSIPIYAEKNTNFVSVKTYGAILRALFNASYLNQFYSNKLLENMSSSSFRSGIVAGVPSDMVVANKFGERIMGVDPEGKINDIELHDCGIIYASPDPYVLCIMTQGDSYDKLTDAIAEISKNIYKNR